MKKRINLFVCLLLLAALISVPNTTAYAKDDITGIKLEAEMRAMIERGVIQGFGPGNYEPFLNVTRGQFAAFITRALELPAGPAVFSDVPKTSKLFASINSASAAGIVNGYTKTTFGPNDPISREQASAMIDNAMKYKGIIRAEAALNFSDASEISNAFKPAVAKNAKDGIIRGIPNSDGTFRFAPKKTATRAEAAAFIGRMLNVIENGDASFKIATIENGELVIAETPYEKFDSAKSRLADNNQVIVKQGKIVYMAAGLVRSNTAITLYKAADFSRNDDNFSYSGNQEMKYLDATEQYVKVQVADTTAFAKIDDVTLIPSALVDGRNYYTVEAGELLHYVYKPASKAYEFYSMGKTPAFLTAGAKYYSWNGVDFVNASGISVGKGYQYFNYLSARSKTNYTAADLDKAINQRLVEIENKYPTKFKDATKLSKLIGLGSKVKAAEEKYSINALLILGIAIHESDYGMSSNALNKNNLFGLSAVDYNPGQATTFTTVDESIDVLATQFLNKNYIEPTSDYFHGAVLGNKSTGFNVKYAADPFWGQKIAGHMYRVDKSLGSKDLGFYEIAETNRESVNVRANMGTNSFLQFEYADAGVPVTIKTSTKHSDGYVWYEIVSDVKAYEKAFVREDVVTKVSVIK